MTTPTDPDAEDRSSKNSSGDESSARRWMMFSGLGFEFAAFLLITGGLGWWLDRKFDTRPWLMIGLGTLGFIAAMVHAIRLAGRSFRN